MHIFSGAGSITHSENTSSRRWWWWRTTFRFKVRPYSTNSVSIVPEFCHNPKCSKTLIFMKETCARILSQMFMFQNIKKLFIRSLSHTLLKQYQLMMYNLCHHTWKLAKSQFQKFIFVAEFCDRISWKILKEFIVCQWQIMFHSMSWHIQIGCSNHKVEMSSKITLLVPLI